MKVLKKVLVALLLVFIVLQAFRPAKNNSKDTTHAIGKTYPVPENVQTILSKACYDCHSNNTRYPWYAEIQPVAWWLEDHVKEGKKELNFDEFGNYKIARQYRKLEECIEEVKEGKMPMHEYTKYGFHADAKLSDEEKRVLADWCVSLRDTIKSNNPPDSLILPRKK